MQPTKEWKYTTTHNSRVSADQGVAELTNLSFNTLFAETLIEDNTLF